MIPQDCIELHEVVELLKMKQATRSGQRKALVNAGIKGHHHPAWGNELRYSKSEVLKSLSRPRVKVAA